MLSRVAAVKAPRTHNRRRVTGSSGRRREGGESERQRPNMSRRVFTFAVLLLFLLVMMCCACEAAHAENSASGTDPKFEWKDANGGVGDVTVKSLGVPGLLKVGSDVFAVAEAQCKERETIFTGIATQLVTTAKANEPKEVLKDAKDKTQFLEEGTTAIKKKVDVSRPTTVVKENEIYLLAGKYSRTAAADDGESGAGDWGLLLMRGNVSVEGGNRKLQWNENQRLVRALFEGEQDSLMQLVAGGGSGIQTEDGTLVFPVEATKKNSGQSEVVGGKTVLLLMYSSDASNWKLSKGMSADGCSDPCVVEWKDKKLMMMAACGDGRRRVYESVDMGESWTEALGTLSRVWGSPKGANVKAVGSGFVTATVGNGDDDKRRVMLVTLPVPPTEREEEEKEKGELHLWLTDNTHIVDIGSVSVEGEDKVTASSLLYKGGETDGNNEELIALYEKDRSGEDTSSNSLWSALLTEQLKRVKDVLATWKKVDERVSKLCPTSSAAESTSTGTACTSVVTDGLVGFLSGNFSENTWRDEYLGVNATVKSGVGAAGTTDGVKFRGAGAEWPVGKQGRNQLYHFANYNFTLVATVSIDKESTEGNIPLMGAKMNDAENPVLLGLSYNNKEKKWTLLCGDGKNTEQNRIEGKEKTHQVAIVLRNGTQGSAYVDGKRVGEPCQLEGKEDKKISHFYIGGDGSNKGSQEGVSVTVTNVLLYNRPLDDSEITALNAIKVPITPPKDQNAQEIVLPSGGTPHAGQEPLNGGKGADGGSASPSASIASTSVPVGQTVQQLASETFPDGNADVDVSPSSSGNPTVGEGSADTIQGDGPHTPSVGNTAAAADTKVLTAKGEGHDGPALTRDVSVSSGADGETAGGTDGQEGIHPQNGEVKSAALSSSLGNLSQGNNSDAGAVRERRALPLLLLLLGLWGFAAV
ncbi:putative trans-sialidase, Group VI [Trypanosoma cruzi]|uniref:Trans-sialidase, putative n=2 Tax=Trypanosoma cruzi TaxID=5693 RepID=Q4DJE0_TRYCC|nr:trans-sialidase, putative [Trypanosoma cruzi]EAN92641.1 trans-sialidase, putative [Trypanosoma cruzi]PWV15855.1 putative trans-sialidase, Group VI [Trypanosoma cruzi]RNC35562.1 putative trans-sialidase [Trypanosoma cruzi]|eukprot:XP_814492.1 trans-sialidase [Trypanosoma cruzi strain CL Brener]